MPYGKGYKKKMKTSGILKQNIKGAKKVTKKLRMKSKMVATTAQDVF